MSKKKSQQEATKSNSIEDRFVDVRAIPKLIKALFYGRSGTGKTNTSGTFPRPILLLDARDMGTATLSNQKDIKVFYVETWTDLEEVYWYLAEKGKDIFKTVVIDTVTNLQQIAVRHAKGGDAGGTTTKRHWGEAASMMNTWIPMFRELPMNVVFLAQDRIKASEEIDDDEGMITPEVGPWVMPSVATVLNASVDVIGNTFIREREKKVKVGDKTKTKTVTEYCMRIGPHALYTTKLRRDSSLNTSPVPSVIVNPSYEQIVNLINGGKE